MVTKQDVTRVRKLLNKLHNHAEVSLSEDTIESIENMCADYELKYDL